MFYTKCGNPIDPNARFCNNCGEKIEKTEIYPAHEFVLEKSLDEITNNLIQKYGENEDIEQIKEGNYLSDFNSDKSTYKFDYDKSSITFTGSLTDSSAKVNGLKSYNLKYGENIIDIEVISESGIRRYVASRSRAGEKYLECV